MGRAGVTRREPSCRLEHRQQRAAGVDFSGMHDVDGADGGRRRRLGHGLEAIRNHEIPATSLCEKLFERVAHRRRIEYPRRAAFHDAAFQGAREPLGNANCVATTAIMCAPRVAIVEDQRPAQPPRNFLAGQQCRACRRSGDHDSGRQCARDFQRLARGGRCPEIFPSHGREQPPQHEVARALQQALAGERQFQRLGAAMHFAADRQGLSDFQSIQSRDSCVMTCTS